MRTSEVPEGEALRRIHSRDLNLGGEQRTVVVWQVLSLWLSLPRPKGVTGVEEFTGSHAAGTAWGQRCWFQHQSQLDLQGRTKEAAKVLFNPPCKPHSCGLKDAFNILYYNYYLKDRKYKRKAPKHITHLLVHSPSSFNSWTWASLSQKPGIQSRSPTKEAGIGRVVENKTE